ncbi:hypothetical protein DFR44_13812 [Hydromonas duriensis]|uniref:Uncharacterized protein n=1 Tax=Hydromonas duriensis TaxID=1527608 RepID=A0A4R6Y5C2_9BURK|nr:hypothetical protein DFR44_13812 [Hydromonas duriensis]
MKKIIFSFLYCMSLLWAFPLYIYIISTSFIQNNSLFYGLAMTFAFPVAVIIGMVYFYIKVFRHLFTCMECIKVLVFITFSSVFLVGSLFFGYGAILSTFGE